MSVNFKKKALMLMVMFLYLTCTNENLIEKTETIAENNKSLSKLNLNKISEVWMNKFDNYDLDKTIEEENIKKKEDQKVFMVKAKKIFKKRVFVHYMPWFESLEIDGAWGQHWTMTNKNPNIISEEGKREIASHYYPIIGPYSTKDKDLHQYHLLLMKLSGVDGVIFDWYGKRNVLDFEQIKQGMESFINELEKTSIEFAIMYEDRVINEQGRSIDENQMRQAIEDIQYIEKEYFVNPKYIKEEEKNLLMIFGPSYINTPADWSTILESVKTPYNLLTLWGAKNIIGNNNASGEYAWIDKDHMNTLSGYFNNVIDFETNMVGGVAYPRFNDFYIEGGWESPLKEDWSIEGREVEVFRESFNESFRHPIDFIQIATWNDFGEGTVIEPTNEYGFKHLTLLQELTGAPYINEDLAIPYYIYKLRKKYSNNATVKFLMDRAHQYATYDNIWRAKFLISLTMFYFGEDLSV